MKKSPPRRQQPRWLTIVDSRSYIKKVRKALPPEDNAEFAAALIGFKEQRVGVGFLLAKVKDMFKGDKELLNGFNRLMPEKYKISPTYGAHDWISAIGGSVELLNNIRKSFKDDDRTYMAFLEIVGSCGKGRAEEERVHREVADLFAGGPALYVEFTRFLSV